MVTDLDVKVVENESINAIGRLGFSIEKLQRLQSDNKLPGVLFCMRYPDDAGYVWNTIAQGKDKAGFHLADEAKCFIAYPKLSKNATYSPQHLMPVQLDCYNMTVSGKHLLAEFIRQHRVKVIVFMSALPSTVDLAFLRKLGVRTINTENDSFNHRQRDDIVRKSIKFIIRRLLKRQLHDLHLANARSQKSFLSSYAQIPPSRLNLLMDGIDCGRFSPGDKAVARLKTGMQDDIFWVICVAQTRPEKRLDFIIRAAKQVIEVRPWVKVGFMYVGGGDGTLPAELKSLVSDLRLEKHFHFAGRQDDLVPYYRSSDIMVHAAERESFGLAVVEGMACGLPVVASAAAGPRETIVHGKTGALIAMDDFNGFVSAILLYLDDKNLTMRHGSNASTHASSHFSLDRYGKDLAQHVLSFL